MLSEALKKIGIPKTVQKTVSGAALAVVGTATGGAVTGIVNAVTAARNQLGAQTHAAVAQVAQQVFPTYAPPTYAPQPVYSPPPPPPVAAVGFWERHKTPILFTAGGLALAGTVYAVTRRGR